MLIYIIKNIKKFAKEKKWIFIFFLTTLIVTSFFGLFVYSQFESSMIQVTELSLLKDAAIYIHIGETFTEKTFDYDSFIKKLDAEKEDLGIYDYAFIYDLDIKDKIAENDEELDMLMKEESYSFMAFPYPKEEIDRIALRNTMLYDGEGITEKELKNGENVCIFSGSKLNIDVQIQGVRYKVKGEYDSSDNLSFGLIPYKSAVDNNLIPSRVAIKLTGIDNKNYLSVTANTIRKLEKLFPEYTIESAAKEGAYTAALTDAKYLSKDNILVIVMMLLVIMTLCSLYSYIFNIRERQYAIFKVCGAKNIDITKLCIYEMTILYTACYMFSAGLFYILNKTVFYKYQPGFALKVRTETYIICYLCLFMIMLLVFGMFSIKKGKTSPVKMLSDSKRLE